jgi:hypothetical protein
MGAEAGAVPAAGMASALRSANSNDITLPAQTVTVQGVQQAGAS